MNLVGVLPALAFGLFIVLLGFAASHKGFGVNELWAVLLGILVMQLGWLVMWRPAFVVGRERVVLQWAFGRVDIPYARVRRLVLPPETAGLEIELDDGKQSRVSGFGSSMISRWRGNRQEHRILVRFEAMRAKADLSAEDQVEKRLNWFAIIFPASTFLAFVACTVIAQYD
ncbi:hypothetical protein [Stackebrandtia albiflava]|uniref:hypothetical protein n=1 Tax=Stackebrandtia albiflava TaxID=406432 RepID=UPI0011BD787C|nr:hypothetical protein [Stackebrandtia albiflava]